MGHCIVSHMRRWSLGSDHRMSLGASHRGVTALVAVVRVMTSAEAEMNRRSRSGDGTLYCVPYASLVGRGARMAVWGQIIG